MGVRKELLQKCHGLRGDLSGIAQGGHRAERMGHPTSHFPPLQSQDDPSTASAPGLGSQGGSSVRTGMLLWGSAKVSSSLPPQRGECRDYPVIRRWEMRCGMLQALWIPRCEHLGMPSTSLTTLEAAGAGISHFLVLQVN